MNATRKCPHCGEWSRWSQNPSDRCEHCQHLLDPATMASEQARYEREQEEKKRFTVEFIQINPTDPWFTRFYKKIGLGFQIVFVSIISLLLWFITLLAG
ncbi:hypothetical protein WG947_07535 [Pontibacter sp. H259]|uniref:hypothetical protein n=1 Tax=Pontibacter sp. H259 TaxID=3133421 RepID=UPI0030C40B8E